MYSDNVTFNMSALMFFKLQSNNNRKKVSAVYVFIIIFFIMNTYSLNIFSDQQSYLQKKYEYLNVYEQVKSFSNDVNVSSYVTYHGDTAVTHMVYKHKDPEKTALVYKYMKLKTELINQRFYISLGDAFLIGGIAGTGLCLSSMLPEALQKPLAIASASSPLLLIPLYCKEIKKNKTQGFDNALRPIESIEGYSFIIPYTITGIFTSILSGAGFFYICHKLGLYRKMS